MLSKKDDLAAHRAKRLRLDQLERYEGRRHAIGGMILVTTKARLTGTFDATTIDGLYCYTRLWRQCGTGWRVIAGHASGISS